MAQPSGSVLPSDFNYDITSAGDTRDQIIFHSYVYAICKVDLQPSKWSPANREDIYSIHEANVLPEIAASGRLDASIRIGKSTADASAVLTQTGAYSSGWLTTVTESIAQGRTNALPNYNESKVVPRYIIVEAKISRNTTSAFSESVEVVAIAIVAKNSVAYSGNDAISFNGDVISQRINNPFDSLSSFMLKDSIAENINKIIYESTNAFTVPLFGDF